MRATRFNPDSGEFRTSSLSLGAVGGVALRNGFESGHEREEQGARRVRRSVGLRLSRSEEKMDFFEIKSKNKKVARARAKNRRERRGEPGGVHALLLELLSRRGVAGLQ